MVKKDAFKKPAGLFLGPAWLLILIITVIPILYTVVISMTNMNIYHWNNYSFIGFKNYVRALMHLDEGFVLALGRTILWTVLNLSLLFIMSLTVALLLNTGNLFGAGVYKTVLMVPWAMPAYISALIWRNGMYHNQYGLLNKIIRAAGGPGINWLNSDLTAFLSCMAVNLWLSLPFMTLVILGGLQSIDRTYYESAELEGAGFFKQAVYVTLPLLRPVFVPAMVLTGFVTFKQFDIIYLMTQQTGAKTGANIHTVITFAFEKAFVTNNYGFSSALSVIIFIIIVALIMINRTFIEKGESVW